MVASVKKCENACLCWSVPFSFLIFHWFAQRHTEGSLVFLCNYQHATLVYVFGMSNQESNISPRSSVISFMVSCETICVGVIPLRPTNINGNLTVQVDIE